MIRLIKYLIIFMILIVLIGTSLFIFFPNQKFTLINNLNIFNDNTNSPVTPPLKGEVVETNITDIENLKPSGLSENIIDQADNGVDQDAISNEVILKTESAQARAKNLKDLVSPLPGSASGSITEQNSMANNIDNPSSELNDDSTVNSSINQAPTNLATIEKEPISLLWLSLVFSLLVNVLIILLFFQQMRWRKNIFNGQEVLMPEQWVNSLSDRMMKVFNALDQLGEFSKANYKNINEISEISQTLNNVIDSKEEEIKRFRKGYDEYIYHKFLSKFISITEAVNRLAQKDSVTRDNFENIHFRLTDALEDCRVSVKSIEVGSLYSELGDLVEDNPKTISTENENQNLRVAEVMRPAYLVSSSEGSKVVLPAKVSIYVKN